MPAVVDDERGLAVERGLPLVQHGGRGERLRRRLGLVASRVGSTRRRRHPVRHVGDERKPRSVGDEAPVAVRGLRHELPGRCRRGEALTAPRKRAGDALYRRRPLDFLRQATRGAGVQPGRGEVGVREGPRRGGVRLGVGGEVVRVGVGGGRRAGDRAEGFDVREAAAARAYSLGEAEVLRGGARGRRGAGRRGALVVSLVARFDARRNVLVHRRHERGAGRELDGRGVLAARHDDQGHGDGVGVVRSLQRARAARGEREDERGREGDARYARCMVPPSIHGAHRRARDAKCVERGSRPRSCRSGPRVSCRWKRFGNFGFPRGDM